MKQENQVHRFTNKTNKGVESKEKWLKADLCKRNF